MRQLRCERGGVRILALGALIAIAIILAETWRRSRSTENRAEEAFARGEIEAMLEPLRTRLKNPETCEQLLRGARLSPGESRAVNIQYAFDEEARAGVTVTASAVALPAKPDMDTQVEIEGRLTPFVRFPALLELQFETKTASGHTLVVDRAGPTGLPFLAWVDREGFLKSCFGQGSAGTLCNDLGGYFFSRLPEGESYDQSCRQSLFTRRLDGRGRATAIGTCRVARGGSSADACKELHGSERFKAYRFQDGFEGFAPEIASARYLCLQCQ